MYQHLMHSIKKTPHTFSGKTSNYLARKIRILPAAIEETTKLTAFLREKNYAMLAASENIQIIDGTASFISDHEIKITSPE